MHDSGKRLTILTVKEIQALYGLPQFTDEEKATSDCVKTIGQHRMFYQIDRSVS
jgi:hypothetical protein